MRGVREEVVKLDIRYILLFYIRVFSIGFYFFADIFRLFKGLSREIGFWYTQKFIMLSFA